MLIKRRAQSTLEYALIVAVVVGGLIAMQVYIKRGLQGKLKESADQLGEQYSPGYTTGTVTVNTTSSTQEDLASGITSTESTTAQNITSSDQTTEYSEEYWGE